MPSGEYWGRKDETDLETISPEIKMKFLCEI